MINILSKLKKVECREQINPINFLSCPALFIICLEKTIQMTLTFIKSKEFKRFIILILMILT